MNSKNKLNRLNPFWDEHSGAELTGLIQLINDALNINPSKNQTWLEIGSYYGESALAFSSFEEVKKLFCIDPLEEEKESIFKKRLNHVWKKIESIKSFSWESAHLIENNTIDLLYLDANKSYDFVKGTLELYLPKIKHKGLICGHDYCEHAHKELVLAVDEFINQHSPSLFKKYIDHSYLIQI